MYKNQHVPFMLNYIACSTYYVVTICLAGIAIAIDLLLFAAVTLHPTLIMDSMKQSGVWIMVFRPIAIYQLRCRSISEEEKILPISILDDSDGHVE